MSAAAVSPPVVPSAAAEVYFCANRNRRAVVLTTASLNGIDFLEVASATDQTLLFLTFLRDPSALGIGPDQIVISGGESVTGIQALSVAIATDRPLTLAITVDKDGDFSPYALTRRADSSTVDPPSGVDPALSQVAFSFKAGCPVSADCLPIQCCPPGASDIPDINYTAKDYPGFLQVMLDRMAVLAPNWTERHAADLGVTLVEVLAYLADHLSYQQDAVATEAYLGTARSRISLSRHAKLVNYQVDEGENAKVWVHVEVAGEGVPLPLGTQVLPRFVGVTPWVDPDSRTAQTMLAQQPIVFATLAAATLSATLNKVSFYTWSDSNCCLPVGANAATLAGHLDMLSPGDVLLFEEIAGPLTGAPEDANRRNRWIVRLTGVTASDRFGTLLIDPANPDPATNQITLIEWDVADALPFPLCLSSVTDEEHGARRIADVSVARGNMAPADHGLWQDFTAIGSVPEPPPLPVGGSAAARCCVAGDAEPRRRPIFIPPLPASPQTNDRTPFDPT